MRLSSRDGAWAELRPVRYQFGPEERDEWDRNWLVVRGDVGTADGATWSFTEPCLTTWEARRLGAWLEAVGRQEVAPSPTPPEREDGDGDGDGVLSFTEPNIALSLESATPDGMVVRLRLSLESAPPESTGETPLHLLLRVTADQLRRAAQEWRHDVAGFPER